MPYLWRPTGFLLCNLSASEELLGMSFRERDCSLTITNQFCLQIKCLTSRLFCVRPFFVGFADYCVSFLIVLRIWSHPGGVGIQIETCTVYTSILILISFLYCLHLIASDHWLNDQRKVQFQILETGRNVPNVFIFMIVFTIYKHSISAVRFGITLNLIGISYEINKYIFLCNTFYLE